jgi:hypothetical protein
MATQPDHVNSGAIATMFALTALATVAAALGITALVRSEQGELSRVRDEPISRAYRSLRAEQDAGLNAAPAWVDREKGLVSLPIAKAMELTLQDIRRGRTVVGARKPDETAPEDAVTPEGGANTADEGSGAVEGTQPGEEGRGSTPGVAPTDPIPTGPGSTAPQPSNPQKGPSGPQGATNPSGSTGGGAASGQDSRGAGAQGQGARVPGSGTPGAGTPPSTGAQGAGQTPAGTPSGKQEGPGR